MVTFWIFDLIDPFGVTSLFFLTKSVAQTNDCASNVREVIIYEFVRSNEHATNKIGYPKCILIISNLYLRRVPRVLIDFCRVLLAIALIPLGQGSIQQNKSHKIAHEMADGIPLRVWGCEIVLRLKIFQSQLL